MLVIVEGVDGTGKTTLCKNLYGFNIKSVKPVPRDNTKQYKNWKKVINFCRNCNYTVDRSFISELVYRIYDGLPVNMYLKDMLKILKKCVIIYCKTDTAYEDSMQRGETNIVTKKDNEEIAKIYETIMMMLNHFANVPVFVYNWRKGNIYDVVDFIKNQGR